MWVRLATAFDYNQSEVNVHLLQQQFYNCKKESNESISLFISRIENIAHKLSSVNSEIPQNMLLTKVLMSLPEEYGFFHCAWESTTENQKTLENLTLRLKTEELRLRAEEKPIALATSSKSKVEKNDRLCFYCKKPGHVKKNCFKYRAKMSAKIRTVILAGRVKL